MKKKKTKIIEVDINFEPEDRLAIICALPLLSYDAATSNGLLESAALIQRIGYKLRNGEITYSYKEAEAIAKAIELAIAVVTGKRSDLLSTVKEDSDYYESLRKYYFTLNLMAPIFKKILNDLKSAASSKV